MKVLLYTEGYKTISKSGLGKAIKHQMRALEDNKVEYTTNLKDDYDVLHINFYGPKSYLYAKKMRKKGKKIVYHAHSTEEDFRNSFLLSNLVAPLFKKWICKCYRLGDQIITPTEYSKRLLENYNLGRPIKAISNGVDTKFFERDPEKGKKFRETYGYKDTDKVIVGIGLYIERKGILDFVELAKRLPQYKFIWFGYSPLWASPRKIKKAVTTKLDNLRFAGYVESEMIKSALSGANLYIFPTLEETEGIPIIEALTSRIPTLIRDIPVFEEYEENKVVYKAKDVDDFEKKIKLILEGKLPNITEEGYKCAKKKDVKIVGKELIDTYKETLNMKREEETKISKAQYFRSLAIMLGVFLTIILMILFPEKFNEFNKEMKTNKEYSTSFKSLNTDIDIKIYTNSKSKADKALREIEDLYKEYDKLTDRTNKNSDIYNIKNNNSKDEYITIDKRTYNMIKYGLDLYESTNHTININSGDLTDLWYKYKESSSFNPTKKELDKVNTDIKLIELKDDNKIKNNHVNIDLDLIKRGYITSKVEDTLHLLKIDSYIINYGGNVTIGKYYKDNGKYIINIKSPELDSSKPLATLRLDNKTISTVSLYEKYYGSDKAYSHIIDTNTKKSADNMIGVTVICNNNTKCDAVSNRLFLMTIEDGIKLVNSNKDIEALWTYEKDGKIVQTASDYFYNFE